MDLLLNIGYKEILGLVMQLPDKERKKLIKEVSTPKKQNSSNNVKADENELTALQKILLNGPTWTDEEYKNFKESRKHINRLGKNKKWTL